MLPNIGTPMILSKPSTKIYYACASNFIVYESNTGELVSAIFLTTDACTQFMTEHLETSFTITKIVSREKLAVLFPEQAM
jgi:hypothetical protein